MLRRLSLSALVLTTLAAPLFGATRMTYEINGTPTSIEWAPTAFPLRYEIDQKLAAARPEAAAMVDRAFAAWEAIPGANVSFQSNGVVATSRNGSLDRIGVTIADDLFAGQGAAAITSYTFDTKTGRMLDADITVDKSLFDGGLNAQLAIQHEIGHVLGLDHSGVLSSIMYPYVGANDHPAEFDLDDRIAIANMYPKGDPNLTGATLTGRVMGDGGGLFAAQVVAVNAQGQPVGTALTNSAGEFTLAGIPAGRYRLYAEPLDGPMGPEALQGSWRSAKITAFPTEFYGGTVEVENGRVYGNLVVTSGGPAQINPKWIGVAAIDRADVSLSTSPATVRPGDTVRIYIGGDGFTSGMTEFEILNPAFRKASEFTWASNYVSAVYVVAPDAPATSAVVLVKSGRETATLTGALRVYRASAGGKTRAARH